MGSLGCLCATLVRKPCLAAAGKCVSLSSGRSFCLLVASPLRISSARLSSLFCFSLISFPSDRLFSFQRRLALHPVICCHRTDHSAVLPMKPSTLTNRLFPKCCWPTAASCVIFGAHSLCKKTCTFNWTGPIRYTLRKFR